MTRSTLFRKTTPYMLRCDDVVQVMRKNSIQYTETVPIYVSLINDIARLEFKARSVCSKCVFKSYPYIRTQKKNSVLPYSEIYNKKY
jgi:hypothetical protein